MSTANLTNKNDVTSKSQMGPRDKFTGSDSSDEDLTAANETTQCTTTGDITNAATKDQLSSLCVSHLA